MCLYRSSVSRNMVLWTALLFSPLIIIIISLFECLLFSCQLHWQNEERRSLFDCPQWSYLWVLTLRNGERLCLSLGVFPFDSMCSLDPCIKILYIFTCICMWWIEDWLRIELLVMAARVGYWVRFFYLQFFEALLSACCTMIAIIKNHW